MKMEPTVSSETSAIRTQTPGNYPKRNKLHRLDCFATVIVDAPLSFYFIQGEHKVFPWLQTFIIRKLLYVEDKLFFSFLFLSFRRVLNVIYSFLGNSPASEF